MPIPVIANATNKSLGNSSSLDPWLQFFGFEKSKSPEGGWMMPVSAEDMILGGATVGKATGAAAKEGVIWLRRVLEIPGEMSFFKGLFNKAGKEISEKYPGVKLEGGTLLIPEKFIDKFRFWASKQEGAPNSLSKTSKEGFMAGNTGIVDDSGYKFHPFNKPMRTQEQDLGRAITRARSKDTPIGGYKSPPTAHMGEAPADILTLGREPIEPAFLRRQGQAATQSYMNDLESRSPERFQQMVRRTSAEIDPATGRMTPKRNLGAVPGEPFKSTQVQPKEPGPPVPVPPRTAITSQASKKAIGEETPKDKVRAVFNDLINSDVYKNIKAKPRTTTDDVGLMRDEVLRRGLSKQEMNELSTMAAEAWNKEQRLADTFEESNPLRILAEATDSIRQNPK